MTHTRKRKEQSAGIKGEEKTMTTPNRCVECGRAYETSLALGAPTTKLLHCRVCPVGHEYAACEGCTDLDALYRQPCPWCHASNMWEKLSMSTPGA